MSAGLVTLGETMLALTAPRPGPLRHQPHLLVHVAGAESNVAIAVRRLGGDAAWIGRVGDDDAGDSIVVALRGEGVDIRHVVRDPDAPTGLMLKTAPAAAVRRVGYYRSGSAGSGLSPQDLPLDAIRTAGALHVTGITPALGPGPRAAVSAAVEEARGARVPVSFDVNYRAALWDRHTAGPVLRELAATADVLVAGEEEAALLGAEGTPAEVVRALAALGPGQVVLTRGPRGAVALADDELVEVPARPTVAVDPVGAGDAFVGGYLAELLAGADVRTRVRTAADCAAFAVAMPGDWEGLPTRRELGLLAAPDGTVTR